MRMLFCSSDIAEIGRVGREFEQAGIRCGVRYDPPREGACPTPPHAELWIHNEKDFYQAVVLYLRLGGQQLANSAELSGKGPTQTLYHPGLEGASGAPPRPTVNSGH
jgi:hypothetical protein